MAKANIRFSDLSSISFNDDWKGCANYQRVPFAQKFLPTDFMRVQFAINADAPLPVIQVIDKCTGRPFAARLTYMLDFATPETVTVEVAPGTLIALQTPAELGFDLPVTHVFQSWTYLGQDITEIVVREDIVVEGRLDIVGKNLLLGSRYIKIPSPSFTTSNNASGIPGAEVIKGADYNIIKTNSSSASSGNFAARRYPNNSGPEQAIYAFSAIFEVPFGITLRTIYIGYIARNNSTFRAWINGIECACAWSGGRSNWAITVPTIPTETPHILEFVAGSVDDFASFGFANVGGGNIAGIRLYLPKLEEVTDRAPEDQRATAWIPHVDDPVEGGVIPPDPSQPPGVAGITDLAGNLIERYSNETDMVYDLPIEVGRDGDYEVQFSYGDAVIARSSFAIRQELCCSKLLQYNNRENDFGTIFTPGEPFYTRLEGEFRPEDDEYGVEDEGFRDQDYSLHQMSASPTTVRKLSFGGEYGSPNFIGNKVNRIFACSEVYIDGERYVRAEGAGVTKEVWSEDYPKYPWKIDVEKREQGFFKAEYEIPETT